MSLIFVSSATLLLMCVAVWLGRTLWRGPKLYNDIEHHDVNATVLRDQLVELERDFANGAYLRAIFLIRSKSCTDVRSTKQSPTPTHPNKVIAASAQPSH